MSKKITSSSGTVFYVLDEFLRRCPDPIEWDNYDLITKFKLPNYLHNDVTHAIPSQKEFWYEGKKYSKEEWGRLSFATKMESFLDEEE